jgi:site-specific recombinase XerD
MNNNKLADYIHAFLQDYVTLQKGYSTHTIMSYRDTIKLLLVFTATDKKKSVADLTLADLTQNMVVDFLDHLEKQRKNTVQTRNIRLSCIHSFFDYIANQAPLLLNHCQGILAIPFKRAAVSTAEYLEPEEMKAIFAAVDRGTPDGYRDYTLLFFMYNTGSPCRRGCFSAYKSTSIGTAVSSAYFGKRNEDAPVSFVAGNS